MEKNIEENAEEKLKDKVKMSMLCEYYGKLLTEKQYMFLNDYYNNSYYNDGLDMDQQDERFWNF